MGNNISISDSLLITVFSMVVVFVVLIAISYLIDLLRLAINGKKDKEETEKASIIIKEKQIEKSQEIKAEENSNDEELVAVITAAIAASLGVATPEVNIKSIKRVSQTTPTWAEMGRREQILGKL